MVTEVTGGLPKSKFKLKKRSKTKVTKVTGVTQVTGGYPSLNLKTK
jgi:hypothetical protein